MREFVTGQLGSVRYPRILSTTSRGPQGTFSTLPTNRYVNDRASPLFIERLNILPLSAAQVFSGDLLQVSIRFKNQSITAQPVSVGVLFESLANSEMPILTWRLDFPLIMFQGDFLEIRLNGGANIIVSAMGYYESHPAVQQYRYIPYVLSDRVFVNDGEVGEAREEALRNDGRNPFYVSSVMFRVANPDNELSINGPGADWMKERLQTHMSYINYRANPLFDTMLKADETLAAAVENNLAHNQAFDVAFKGYKIERLPARLAAPERKMLTSAPKPLLDLGNGLRLRRRF